VNLGSDVGDGPTGTAVEWSSRTRSGEDIGQHDPGEERVVLPREGEVAVEVMIMINQSESNAKVSIPDRKDPLLI
jgi:hypothetical protein